MGKLSGKIWQNAIDEGNNKENFDKSYGISLVAASLYTCKHWWQIVHHLLKFSTFNIWYACIKHTDTKQVDVLTFKNQALCEYCTQFNYSISVLI